MSANTLPKMLPRGVYIAPFLSDRGHPVLVAVDSSGRMRRQRAAQDDDQREAATLELTGLLDLLDPPAR